MFVRRFISVLTAFVTLGGLGAENVANAQPRPVKVPLQESAAKGGIFVPPFFPSSSTDSSGSHSGQPHVHPTVPSGSATSWAPRSATSSAPPSSAHSTKQILPAFHVVFAPTSGNGPLVTYINGQDQLTFSLQNERQVRAQLSASAAVYPDILSGVDVTYTVGNNGLKEGIVLKRQTSPTTLTFTVEAKHLYVRDVASQGLILYDNTTHKPVALIPNPVVTDAHGNTSKTAATMQAHPTRDGQFVVVVNLSKGWLDAAGRAFPVNIDPSVVNVTGPVWNASTASVPGGPLGRVDYGSLGMLSPGSSPQELLGLRTSNSETFLNPNGTLTTTVFETPQFYRDSTGAWHSIDNTVVQSKDPNYAYQNGANDFTVYFSGTAASAHMVHFERDGDTIDFGLSNGNSASSAAVSGNKLTFHNALARTFIFRSSPMA